MTEIVGPIEVEARNTDIKIDDIKGLKAPLRINSTSVEIVVRGLRAEARLDGRNSVLEVTPGGAGAGDDLQPRRYPRDRPARRLHARRGSPPKDTSPPDDGDLKAPEGGEQHITGAVRGGVQHSPSVLRAAISRCENPRANNQVYSLPFTVTVRRALYCPPARNLLPRSELHGRGKVRDIYQVGDDLLLVATDRISAFDYVLGSGIPDKGKVLTQLSAFWFERMGDLVPDHVIATDVEKLPPAALQPYAATLRGRSMLCRRTRPLPIECVARGYLSGSGWKEYQQTGRVCGITLPSGLRESDRLPRADLHAGDQAETGHDINISEGRGGEDDRPSAGRSGQAADARDLQARLRARRVQGDHHRRHQVRIRPGRRGQSGDRRRAHRRGAYARFVAVLAQGSVPAGGAVPSFDKQYVRDYLEEIRWNKQAAGAVAPRPGRAPHAREIRRSVPPPLGSRAPVGAGAGPNGAARLRDAGQGRPLRRGPARVREDCSSPGRCSGPRATLGIAADLLGVHRNTIARKIAEYRIKRSA